MNTVLRPGVAAIMLMLAGCSGRSTADPAPLAIEATIALPNTKGRIDHLALDSQRNRLFIAEIGNGTVDVVDLKATAVVGRIDGLEEPQGLAYLPDRGELVVACGGDGTVRFYDAMTLQLKQMLSGFDDADNVRIDPASGDIVVGYGAGGLVLIDPATRAVTGKVALPSHPEGFQIDLQGHRAYVNLPRSLKIAVVDLATRKVVESWSAGRALENFPMAIDTDHQAVAAGFRVPGRFMVFDSTTGKIVANNPACGEADDLFFDARRDQYYMLCGDGHIDVFGAAGTQFKAKARITTQRGGRTGLFSRDRDRLFVAISSEGESGAAVEIYTPSPK